MPEDIQKIAYVATQALKDPAFAQEILEGKQDHPEVRNAMLADLAESNQQPLTPGAKPGTHLLSLADRAKGW
jgi:hypothetical protein